VGRKPEAHLEFGQFRGEAVAADPEGNVHVVWSDDTTGVAEIYYRKYVN
jgi:hypothetical protein